MFNVKYSLQKDAQNYLNVIWKLEYYDHGRKDLQDNESSGFPQKFLKKLRSIEDRRIARKYILEFLQNQHPYFNYKLNTITKFLPSILEKRKVEIIEKLETIYGKKFPFSKIQVYLTTLKICPYDFNNQWYMVSIYGDSNNHFDLTLHELNHFMFIYYFAHLKKELGKEYFESLKEALTVFTNPEEKGYPNQLELRAWLKCQNISITDIIKRNEWRRYFKSLKMKKGGEENEGN